MSEAAKNEEEVQAYILKDISADESPEACYVFVEEEKELEAVSAVFQQMLEDTDLSGFSPDQSAHGFVGTGD